MRIVSKINYDKFSENLFLVYICFLYAFPYQMLEIELVLLVLLLPKLKKIKKNIFLGWSMAYVSILLFSSIYSIEPDASLFKSFQVLKNLIFANLLISSINSKEGVEKIFKYFVVAGFVLAIKILLIFPIDKLGKTRLQIIGLFNANDLALKWCFSLVFLLYFIFIKHKKNIFNFFLTFLFYMVIIFTGSRKGFFLGSVSILFVWLFKIKNKIKFFLILFFTIILIIIFYKEIINIPIIYNVLGKRIEELVVSISGEQIDSSTLTRVNMIKDGIDYLIKKPLLGYGVSMYSQISIYKTYSHNNYIELLTGIGIPGTMVYYFIYFYNLIFSFIFLKKRKFIIIPSCILIITIIALEIGLVTYDARDNTLVLALIFLTIDILKRERNKKLIGNLIDRERIL